MSKYETKQYPDTVKGCKEFVAYESILAVVKSTKFEPDPAVEGVWKVSGLETKGTRSKTKHTIVLYMAGYKDPWGQIRESNDFEEMYSD